MGYFGCDGRSVAGEQWPVTAPPRCGVPSETPLLAALAQGRADELTALLDGLRELDAAAVVVCSVEGGAQRIREEARRAGVARRVHTVRVGDDLRGFVASADLGVVAHPDEAYALPVPLEVFTYLEAGLPVIAPDGVATRKLLSEYGLGETYLPDDGASLAAAARAVLGSRRDFAAVSADYRLGQATRWPSLGSRPIRLGMGTANSAGQLAQLARALSRTRRDVSAEVLMTATGGVCGYPADVCIDPPSQKQRHVQRRQSERASRYTHLIVDGFRAFLGFEHGTDAGADLPYLRRDGLRIALLAHGSEIRDAGRHLDKYEFSLYRHVPDDVAPLLRRKSARNRAVAEDAGLPLFVTTPDLLDELPGAQWLPLTVDVDYWYCDRPVMERRRPVVVHAPSKRWTKGSAYIVPVLERLHRRGVIEFRLVEGVPSDQMRRFVHDADIVVEQIGIGTYSAFACEAMAAGKPVMAYMHPSNIERMGVAPPVVGIEPDTLAERLESMIDDPTGTRRIASASLQFARMVHDGRWSAARLQNFLGLTRSWTGILCQFTEFE
ncbi:glycosyltransferase family protein [Glycomyces tarimensis]